MASSHTRSIRCESDLGKDRFGDADEGDRNHVGRVIFSEIWPLNSVSRTSRRQIAESATDLELLQEIAARKTVSRWTTQGTRLPGSDSRGVSSVLMT
jgi:hypothetical protein